MFSLEKVYLPKEGPGHWSCTGHPFKLLVSWILQLCLDAAANPGPQDGTQWVTLSFSQCVCVLLSSLLFSSFLLVLFSSPSSLSSFALCLSPCLSWAAVYECCLACQLVRWVEMLSLFFLSLPPSLPPSLSSYSRTHTWGWSFIKAPAKLLLNRLTGSSAPPHRLLNPHTLISSDHSVMCQPCPTRAASHCYLHW